MEPSGARSALPRGGHGRALPPVADHDGLEPGRRGRVQDHRLSVHGGRATRRGRALSRRGAATRTPRGPPRQLPDRRLSPHGRGHRAGSRHRARHRGRDRVGGGDPPPPGPHGDPWLCRGRPRARALRFVPARVLWPLRRGARSLLHVRGRHQPARRGGGAGLSRPLRLWPGRPWRVPRPLRRGHARRGAASRHRAGVVSAPTNGVSANELLAVMGSRELKDNSTVFAGVGAPMLASGLAQRTHAPRLTMVVEGGVVGPTWKPGELPISTNEMRAGYRAQMLPAITDIFLFAQRGFLDVGFIGGAQIDQYGNLNTSAIGGSYDKPAVRLPGSGGANDIISLCREVMILTIHEKRRFTERVDFVTSPGYLDGGDSRRRHGLLFGGVSRVITTLGVFGFEAKSRRMQLLALHPGCTVEQVHANTGFDVLVSDALTTTEPPTDKELDILRMLDPIG